MHTADYRRIRPLYSLVGVLMGLVLLASAARATDIEIIVIESRVNGAAPSAFTFEISGEVENDLTGVTDGTFTPPGGSEIALTFDLDPNDPSFTYEESFESLVALEAKFGAGDYLFRFSAGAKRTVFNKALFDPGPGFAKVTAPNHGGVTSTTPTLEFANCTDIGCDTFPGEMFLQLNDAVDEVFGVLWFTPPASGSIVLPDLPGDLISPSPDVVEGSLDSLLAGQPYSLIIVLETIGPHLDSGVRNLTDPNGTVIGSVLYTDESLTTNRFDFTVAASGHAPFIPGDIDDNREVNVLDATVLRRDLADLGPGISQMCFAQLPATGQVTCWNSIGTIIPCAGTGQDGDVQAGAPLIHQDNGDGTITDLNTGLMWEKLSDDGSIHDWDDNYIWDDAFAVKIATLNDPNDPFAGHTDWRVPNYKELVSILDLEAFLSIVSPAFNTGCAPACTVLTCSCTALTLYWSSSSLLISPANAWSMEFRQGLSHIVNKAADFRVRAVRGP